MPCKCKWKLNARSEPLSSSLKVISKWRSSCKWILTGVRESDINVAEGKKQARILNSEAFMAEQINQAKGDLDHVIREVMVFRWGWCHVGEGTGPSGGNWANRGCYGKTGQQTTANVNFESLFRTEKTPFQFPWRNSTSKPSVIWLKPATRYCFRRTQAMQPAW